MKPKLIRSLIAKLINTGINEKTRALTAPYIRQVNTNGLLFFSLDTALSIIFYVITKNPKHSLALLISGFSFLVCSIGLNLLSFTRLSRLSTTIIGTLIITYLSIVLGPEANAETTLILGAILPFTQFHLTERKEISVSLLFPLFAFFALWYINQTRITALAIPNYDEKNLSILLILFIFSYLCVAFNTAFIVHQHNLKQTQLAQSEAHLAMIFKALSHDMGTPLQLLSMLSYQGTRDGVLNSQQTQRLKKATESATEIFNKLRQVAFLNGGKIPTEIAPSPVLKLLNEAIENLKDRLDSKSLQIHIHNQSSINDPICLLDRNLFLYQVLNNLLTNAIKFSNPGETIDVFLLNNPPHFIRLMIQDHGIGIRPSELSKIFNWQAVTTKKGTFGEPGTGLGLPLVKVFLKAMNMEISVSSRAKQEHTSNHGTTIEIDLPLVIPVSLDF